MKYVILRYRVVFDTARNEVPKTPLATQIRPKIDTTFGGRARAGAALAGRAAVAAGFLIVSAGFAFAWYRHCHGVAFWMDEVLAVATARLKRAGDVVAAIWAGAEFSPPGFDLLLHWCALAAPGAPMLARLPAGLAVAAAGLVVAACLWRPAGAAMALLGYALTLGGSLFYFAIQARPYGLLALCLAIALYLWLGWPAQRGAGRACGLWAVAAASVSLHVYGVLVPGCIGTAELVYALATRRLRWSVWAALLLVLPVLAAWAPLYLHLASFNAADNRAAAYYAKPRPAAFMIALGYLLLPHVWRHGAIAAGGLVAAVVAAVAAGRAPRRAADETAWRWRAALLALTLLPFAGFALGALVTGSFAPRYIAGVALLPALGLPYALRDLKPAALIAAILVPLIAETAVAAALRQDWAAPSGELTLLAHAPATPAPIVIDQGQHYIELMETLPPAVAARCVFVTTSPGIVRPDPTNENQVRRLARLLPGYHVQTAPAFLAAHPKFFVLSGDGVAGTGRASLSAAGAVITPVARSGDATLYLGRAP
jgi:hypothetical protein